MTVRVNGVAAVVVAGMFALGIVAPVAALTPTIAADAAASSPAPGTLDPAVDVRSVPWPGRLAATPPLAVPLPVAQDRAPTARSKASAQRGKAPVPSGDAPAPQGQRWVAAETAPIHPGVVTDTAGGGRCTSNFVFTAGARTFLGQAAHCAGTGTATETNGCASGTRPLGTPVTVNAADGSKRRGSLVYSSWVTMQQLAENDPETCAYNDFALVELATGDARQVNPSMPVIGGPIGLDTDGLPAGEPVFSYCGSAAGGPDGGEQRGPRAGASAGDVGGGFGHRIYTASPGVPGQSGSALIDSAGAAVGVLTTLNLSARPVNSGGTDLAAALGYANAHGGLGEVQLALGTVPFSAVPARVP